MESSGCRVEVTIGNRAAISIKTMKLILEFTITAIFVQIRKTDKEKEKEREKKREAFGALKWEGNSVGELGRGYLFISVVSCDEFYIFMM